MRKTRIAGLLRFDAVAPEHAVGATRFLYALDPQSDLQDFEPTRIYAFVDAFEVGADADLDCAWVIVLDELDPSGEPLVRIQYWLRGAHREELARFYNDNVDDVEDFLFDDPEYVERLPRHSEIFRSRSPACPPYDSTRAVPQLPRREHSRHDLRRLAAARRRLAQAVAAGRRSDRRTRNESRQARAERHSIQSKS